MSSVVVPGTAPAPAQPSKLPAVPELLRPVPRKPRTTRRWVAGVLLIAVIAGLAWLARERVGSRAPEQELTAVPTATIVTGDIDRTIRVSGVVAAERFAALMAPRLRGSRAASGGYGAAGTKSVGTSAASSSTSTSGTSSSTSSSATGGSSQNSSATSTNTAVTGQSAAPGAPGSQSSSLGAIRGTQNRFGDRQTAQSSSTTTSQTSSSTQSTSSALGSSGLGSTAGNLLGSGSGTSGGAGTGGSTGSDFSLVLASVAKPGARVKKGDIVAEFDRQYQLNRLDDYKATVAQLDANLKHLQADQAVAKEAHDQLVRSAKADWDKALLDLKTAEVRSAIEAEDLKLAARETEAHYNESLKEAKLFEASQRAELRGAEIERDQARIELDRATVNVDRMVVHAPMDGTVVMQTIWRGGDFGQVQQGDQLWPGQTFMQIVDPSSMVILANLNQIDAETVRLGMKATVRLDAYPGAEFPTHIVGVGAMAKAGAFRPNYMRVIPIRLKLDQADSRIIPDISASADLVLASEKQVTVAPLSAIFSDGGGHAFVFLRTPDGWERREIEVGLGNHVAVALRSGVSPGDIVATKRPESKPPS